MVNPDEPLFEYLARHAELVKSREYELGVYAGDGPTAEQAEAFLITLRTLEAHENLTPPVLWGAFQAAVDTEMSWLLPERDPIGEPMTTALRELQTRVGKLLEQVMPEQKLLLDKYVDLAVVVNAASRQVRLHGNGISWRLVLARVLYWIGGGKRS